MLQTAAKLPLLEPGRNCWRVATAGRAAVIVDAADYFAILREAMLAAKQQILIVGWDFDTRVIMDRRNERDGLPDTVGGFILWLADNRPDLRINILVWNFGVLKLAARGSNALTALRWKLHPRIQLRSDTHHPLGGSVHHKIAVIDDTIAFCGGIDITRNRWDTDEHRDNDKRRIGPWGFRYGPWHDTTIAVDRDTARALGELARDRWHRATGGELPAPQPCNGAWPASVPGDFAAMPVAIARTRPAYDGDTEIREVETLFLDMIGRVRRFAYLENQYFASRRIAEAIAARLTEPDGPEFVIVHPHSAEGWLAELAMDPARARLVETLRQVEGAERLGLYFPVTPAGMPIYVHAKLSIFDDEVLRVGSANFNNRSLGLDGECDLAIDAGDDDDAVFTIAALRERLMAEHLGTTREEVRETILQTGSLVAAIEALRGGPGRTLVPYRPPALSAIKRTIADLEILDPERRDGEFEPLDRRSLVRKLRRYARGWRARRAARR